MAGKSVLPSPSDSQWLIGPLRPILAKHQHKENSIHAHSETAFYARLAPGTKIGAFMSVVVPVIVKKEKYALTQSVV